MRQAISKMLTRFDQGCAAVSHTSSVSLDRPLSLKERLGFYMHLIMCDFCRRYHRQLIAIQKLASQTNLEDGNDQPTTPALNEDARERIRRAIDPSAENGS